MSSSDEDVVRRPARTGAGQALSEAGSAPGSPAPMSDAGNMNGADDDDADLFGSDGGSDGGFDQDTEYAPFPLVYHTTLSNIRTPQWIWRTDMLSANLSEPSMIGNLIRRTMRIDMTGLVIVWTMRMGGKESSKKQ